MTCHCCQGPTKKFGRFQNKNRLVQRYRCNKCAKTFSSVQPLSETRIDSEKGVQIVKLLVEGVGINAISRLSGVSKPAVLNVVRSAGLHCKAVLDAKLRNLRPSHVEIDEIWTFVHCKQQNAPERHPVFGDQYCWLSFDEQSKLICNFQIAKRTKAHALNFIGDLRSRIDGSGFDISTDGYAPYRDRDGAIFRYFGSGVNYGVEIKRFGSLDALKPRRYSPMVCTGCQRVLQTGGRVTKSITINHAERQNLNVRLFNRRFTRLTLGYSKKLANLEHAVALFVAFHNFCRPHGSLHKKATLFEKACPQTPAIAAGLTDHVWTVEELLAATI